MKKARESPEFSCPGSKLNDRKSEESDAVDLCSTSSVTAGAYCQMWLRTVSWIGKQSKARNHWDDPIQMVQRIQISEELRCPWWEERRVWPVFYWLKFLAFIHSYKKYLLNNYFVPGTVLGARDTVTKKDWPGPWSWCLWPIGVETIKQLVTLLYVSTMGSTGKGSLSGLGVAEGTREAS